MSLLEIKGLAIHYESEQVLRELSFDVAKGQVVGVTGENGTGKTSVLRSIAGTLKYFGGRISAGAIGFQGVDITNARPEERVRLGIRMVPEGGGNFSSLTVEENLRVASLNPQERITNHGEAFESLRHSLRQKAGSLSGGESMLLGIARAIIADPKLLLLDEPFQGLDIRHSQSVLGVLEKFSNEGGSCIVVRHGEPRLREDLVVTIGE